MVNSFIVLFLGLLFAVILTILVEGGLAYFFLSSKSDLKLVILTQILTNLALNILLLINKYLEVFNRTFLLIILEFFVVIIEALIYKKGFQDKKINPYFLSLFLNLASFIFGLVIEYLLVNFQG